MKKIKILFGLIIVLGLGSCTKDFKKINEDPNLVKTEEASGRYFITNPQFNLYSQSRYSYWRANLIHADRYSGQVCFGNHQIWWSDELGYSYNSAYTDAAWGWMSGYLGQLDNFMKLTNTGGEFENQYMYATGLIMKGLYYQMYTDIFGSIPYTEAADPDITLPKFDDQKTIYKGIIADLDKAMQIIGDATTSGTGIQDITSNDLYCRGDMQKWKKLANSLKLRIAIRAYGAAGDDFSASTVTGVLTSSVLESENDNVILVKDEEIIQWTAAAYGDVWYCCGPDGGSGWRLSKALIDNMQNNNDPRLAMYAQPSDGGEFEFIRPHAKDNQDGYDNFYTRSHFIRDAIADVVGNTDFYTEPTDTTVVFNLPKRTYFIGQPTRLNSDIKGMVRAEFWSKPSEVVYQAKNKEGLKPFNELILTSGETYLLRAEAAVLGLSSENANTMYQNGITQEMKLWDVSDADIAAYLSNSPLGSLTGAQDEMLEMINIQRWIGKYTDGFEAWSIVRKSGYPTELSQGVSDPTIYGLGDIDGDYPTRLRYGTSAYSTNGTNVNAAVANQGPDVQNTKLWWQK